MPTRVDFYVLATEENRTRLVYACRVIEKAFLQRLRVVVNLGSAVEADSFDALLWTFGDRSFVPHALVTGGPPAGAAAQATPDLLAGALPRALPGDLLVNLAAEAPAFYDRYGRVA